MRLYPHTFFGTHKNTSAVNVGVEIYSLLLYLSELSKREHLKSAAVGKYRSVPVHKLVKSAHFIYYIISRTNVKMIGVAKLHLTLEVFEVKR